MPIVKCLICSKKFYVKPNHQLLGWGKFCSIECRSKAQLKGKTVECFMCLKKIYRSPADLSASKSNNFFCSKSCQTIWRNKIVFIGENHPNWKTGIQAYQRILKASNKRQLCTLCNTTDKRILAVHHINQNRHDNRVENLTWLCHNCHFLVHHYSDEKNRL